MVGATAPQKFAARFAGPPFKLLLAFAARDRPFAWFYAVAALFVGAFARPFELLRPVPFRLRHASAVLPAARPLPVGAALEVAAFGPVEARFAEIRPRMHVGVGFVGGRFAALLVETLCDAHAVVAFETLLAV